MTVCASCNAPNSADAGFCENCGKPLAPATGNEATPLTTSEAAASTGAGSEPAAADSAVPGLTEPAAVAGALPTSVPPLAQSEPEAEREYLPGEAPSIRHEAGAGLLPPPSGTCVICGGTGIEDEYCITCGARQPSPRDHYEETPTLWAAGVCDKGIVHARNEDAMATFAAGDGSLQRHAALVVCDGVTTAPMSERASLAAARAACGVMETGFSVGDRTDDSWAAVIGKACIAAQAQAVAVARSLGDPPEPPSCTFVSMVIDGARLHAGWCGDSRAYILPDGEAGIVASVDDSIASQMIAAGTPRAEAEADHRAHTITRWLGADAPDPTAHTASFDAKPNSWVMVVSDGLWNYASEPSAIRALIDAHLTSTNDSTPLGVAKMLVAFANTQGGSDNITVAIARISAQLENA